MGTKPLRVVSCFASLAVAVVGLALTAQVAVASPTPDPAPVVITPSPDPVGGSAAQAPVNKRSSTRGAQATTPIRTGTHGSTPPPPVAKTATAPATTLPKHASAPTKPAVATSIALPVVAPAAAPLGSARDQDRLLTTAIALGALVLASLSLVGLSRLMRTDLPA